MVNVSVNVEPGDNFEHKLREFKSVVSKAEVLRDYGKHDAFTPKQEKRRSKSAKARARQIVGAKKYMKAQGYRRADAIE